MSSEELLVVANWGFRHGVGYDYIHNDADGANMRLDVRSQVK